MAPSKQPKSLLQASTDFLETWILKIASAISDSDQDGKYTPSQNTSLSKIREFLESWLPTDIAEAMIKRKFHDINLGTATKFAILNILNFPDRTSKLILGKK